MKYLAGNTEFKIDNSAVTLGKFDGLHLGHQQLIKKVISFKQKGYTTVLFSFLLGEGQTDEDSINQASLFSDKEFKLIFTEEEKYNRLRKTNLDVLISYPFNQKVKSMEPENFIKDILVDRLGAKIIVVGTDYRFGYQRQGDVELLKKCQDKYGYLVHVLEKKSCKDKIVSSSYIRRELREGNLPVVNELLGQPYSILGEVRHGRKIGRTLGMPTTNLIPLPNKLLPPNGVYASKTLIEGKSYPGVTNIGLKPTVGGEEVKGVETFIFDYTNDLYGKTIEVELYHYQRAEVRFDSLDNLKNQMQMDIEQAKNFFGFK